ncbi:MAG: HDOD domain-containing protein [Gammaproteobacteria bacterium]|nr:HDOD domain-containing protein [Gammaproteobacteria bacterium]
MSDDNTIDHWRERLRGTRLPPLARVTAAAAETPDGTATERWARLYARDVFLSAEVFRLANERAGTHIVRLEQAPVIIGQERFIALGRSAETVEDQLTGEDREALMAALRCAVIAARLAGMWATTLGFRVPDEFYFSALFERLGELLIRYFAPATARRVDEGLGKGRPWHGTEAEVLGFHQRDLGLALARDWDLPQLLLEESLGEAVMVGKAGLVHGAVDVAACIGVADGEARLTALLEELGARWDRSPQHLAEDVFICARDCARDALAWYPRAHDGRYVELYPRPHVWRPSPPATAPAHHQGLAPATSASRASRPGSENHAPVQPASPHPKGSEGAATAAKPRVAPRAAAQPIPAAPTRPAPRPPPESPLSGAPAAATPSPPSGPARPTSSPAAAAPETTNDVISRVVHQIVTATRLERCLFLVVDRKKGEVVVRHHAGLAEDSPLGHLSIGLGDGNLFALVMRKPAVLWVDAAKRRRFQGAIKEPLRALTPAGEFLVASLFIKGRPLGLLYADGESSLTAAHLNNFKKAHGYLVRHLDDLASRRMAQPRG